MSPFQTSPNKDTIRLGWDLPVLRQQMSSLGRNLSYFGMTGPEMHDVRTWKEILSDWTAVEEAPSNAEKRRMADRVAERMQQTAFDSGLDGGLELLRGSVEDIIVDGLDVFGAPVPGSAGERAHDSVFTYDLYNLDFDGGLGYQRQTGRPKRIQALEKLFQRQAGHSFILLLTINVRDTLRTNVVSYLEGLREELGEVLQWYIARQAGEYDHQLKAAVPLFLRHHAEAARFSCTFLPPIVYDGYQDARLVHFACRFEARSNVFPATSPQTRADVLALPLLCSTNGELNLSPVQHPDFSLPRCRQLLAGCCEDIRIIFSGNE
jgi:hypothetical protein